MKRRTEAKRLALCGILAALAVGLMFLGGMIPIAVFACPVLASMVLIPVYCECGFRFGLVWYGAVALLCVLLGPDKEAAILFVFFGYYPMLQKLIGRLRNRGVKWLLKLLYFNISIFAAYALMLYVFRLAAVTEEFRQTERIMLIVFLALGNVALIIYDILIDRLELFYHLRLRPKLKL